MMTLSKSCLSDNSCGMQKMPYKNKIIQENENEIDLSDKNISNLEDLPNMCK